MNHDPPATSDQRQATSDTLRQYPARTKKPFYAKQTQFPPILRQKRGFCPKTKPIQTQFKPNFRKAKMNVSSFKTKDYGKNDIFSVPQNKANSNPIQTQFQPPCAENKPNQTQFQTSSALQFRNFALFCTFLHFFTFSCIFSHFFYYPFHLFTPSPHP